MQAMMTNAVSMPFAGPEVKGPTVTYSATNGRRMLTLSDDFKVPGAPAPHWQVVDSMGNAHLLRRLVTADNATHKSIELPTYVKDVAAVRIYCAYVEVVLGEARFEMPVK